MAAERSGQTAISPVRRAWLRELGIERLWNVPSAVPSGAGMPEAPPAVAAEPAVAAPVAELLPAANLEPLPAAAPTDPEQAWAVLEEEVRHCTACGLCKGRTQTVFGTGSRTARWMLVGEAPGEQEDKQGAPFVGRSGKLLDNMLGAIGRSRQADVFIANVIKCRPPGNRDPLPEEVARCSPYLMRQISLVNPDMILVLGRFAAQTLLETDARIGSLRGRVHTLSVQGKPVPVVVSYHPAYLLRSPAEKTKAWQDLQLALSVAAPARLTGQPLPDAV
ncbi:MAG: uracil-DNA glycosylase [Pigmentiphaga sp.]|uniref:uracil-DNA glycosylase n=1 Tax=Pigmentiphaga sp. TaxID=1977564 RepID=UPI0029A527DF|nr:uracil-DNA glycosylase [Pigmentiphaga sp.]MDX3905659.1 uracil-DNA glycosylase [Pigmentiphaga sp.]